MAKNRDSNTDTTQYNMGLGQISARKGVKGSEKLIDRMGKTELAAHLFRITQTDEKIKRDNVRGQNALEQTAFDVGRRVRTVIEISGRLPEDIPLAEPIRAVRKKIKGASKALGSLDKKKTASKKKPPQNK
jgi:DNA-damage-inducible protein D